MSGPERKAALACLLEQEAYLIASIGRHKTKADVENKEKRDKQFLNKVKRCFLLIKKYYVTKHLHYYMEYNKNMLYLV